MKLSMNLKKMSLQQWGRFCLFFGLAGMLLLYVGGLIPLCQRFLSKTEINVFIHLNKLLGLNPIWDFTLLVTASDYWIIFCYGASFFIFVVYGWRRRREDYGQIFGYILFAMLVVNLTEEMGDIIADNLHRMLPWRQGVVEHIKASYNADFFKMHKDEGIIDDTACGLFALYFLMAIKSPRTALATLIFALLYSASSIIVGTQWLSVQCASVFMGAFFAGLALIYLTVFIRYLEKKASQTMIAIFGKLLLARKIVEPGMAERGSVFWQTVRAKAHALNVLSRRRFWENIVKRRASVLLNADPATTVLYTSPALTMEKSPSSTRVRFLETQEREIFVIRAMSYWGGVIRKSPHFVRFTDSVKNNILLHRLGMPVPRVIWTQEMVSRLGVRNYFFAIEEHLKCRPLNPETPEELAGAMRVLARLHGHTYERWGGLYDESRRMNTQYILHYLRGDILYQLKKIEKNNGLEFTPRELNSIWKLIEMEALDVFSTGAVPYRLLHGDVSPRNFCTDADSQIHLIDFLTVHADLAGWEIIKAAISLTRKYPGHCSLAWEAYFAAAGGDRWREFRLQANLAFARFALREMAHKRARIGTHGKGAKLTLETLRAWVEHLLTLNEAWGPTPAETQWNSLFALLGIHQRKPAATPSEIADSDLGIAD